MTYRTLLFRTAAQRFGRTPVVRVMLAACVYYAPVLAISVVFLLLCVIQLGRTIGISCLHNWFVWFQFLPNVRFFWLSAGLCLVFLTLGQNASPTLVMVRSYWTNVNTSSQFIGRLFT